MERYALSDLVRWKESSNRKPLILMGARQVGKTWLMKEFGRKYYRQVAYLNFEFSSMLRSMFRDDFDILRLITVIQIETGIKINPDDTLIIFDEIQEAERGVTSLKYFYENAPQYHIIAAGSVLGITMHQHNSFPVGKVDFLNLYPMTFTEFLLSRDQKTLVETMQNNDWPTIEMFKSKLINYLRQYYFIGGMPEAILVSNDQNDFEKVRLVQKNILNAYEHDFSKHAPKELVPRIRMIWKSIPAQLSKENRKFIYGLVKQGGRAKEFELSLGWLVDCGLVYKIHRVAKPALPLVSYQDHSAFKLFLLDVGLLAAMGDLSVRTLLEGNAVFHEFKGAITEQFTLQHLITRKNVHVFYWSADRSIAEIDFLLQINERIIPVEVKAEENLKAKSLKSFYDKFDPPVSVRTSMADYRQETWLTNIPLYAFESAQF